MWEVVSLTRTCACGVECVFLIIQRWKIYVLMLCFSGSTMFTISEQHESMKYIIVVWFGTQDGTDVRGLGNDKWGTSHFLWPIFIHIGTCECRFHRGVSSFCEVLWLTNRPAPVAEGFCSERAPFLPEFDCKLKFEKMITVKTDDKGGFIRA